MGNFSFLLYFCYCTYHTAHYKLRLYQNIWTFLKLIVRHLKNLWMDNSRCVIVVTKLILFIMIWQLRFLKIYNSSYYLIILINYGEWKERKMNEHLKQILPIFFIMINVIVGIIVRLKYIYQICFKMFLAHTECDFLSIL